MTETALFDTNIVTSKRIQRALSLLDKLSSRPSMVSRNDLGRSVFHVF